MQVNGIEIPREAGSTITAWMTPRREALDDAARLRAEDLLGVWLVKEKGVRGQCVLALTPNRLILGSESSTEEWPLSSVRARRGGGTYAFRISFADSDLRTFNFQVLYDAQTFEGVYGRVTAEYGGGQSARPIPMAGMTTTPEFPGHRIVAVHGVVSEISSSSIWTAKKKGESAFEAATAGLREQADALGANAIIGLSAAAFGAQGGVTRVVGGDAVGVILLGTAVTIEPLAERPER